MAWSSPLNSPIFPTERDAPTRSTSASQASNVSAADQNAVAAAKQYLQTSAFSKQGLIDQLDHWPNVRLERYQSGDQMFRAQWLQRHVHERLDEALGRMLARLPAQRNELLEEVRA